MKQGFSFGWLEAMLGLLVALIATVDAIACQHFSLWIVYMLPVVLASWLRGARVGFVLAGVVGACLAVDGFWIGHPFVSDSMFLYALISRTLSFGLVAWLCSRLRRIQELEHQVLAYEELCDSLHVGLDSSRKPSARGAQ